MQVKQSVGGLRIAVLLFFYFFLSLGLGVVCAALVFPVASGSSSEWLAGLVAHRGPDSLMRRCMMLWGLILLPFFLKRCGWGGWADLGFSDRASSRPVRQAVLNLAIGLALGLFTLGLLSLLNAVLGIRYWAGNEPNHRLFARIIQFAVSGLGVAFFEETLCRGILFRTPARSWGFWPAAIVGSLFFAGAHFLHADPASFSEHPWPLAAWRALASAIIGIPNASHFPLRFLNLTLLGMTLCALVFRTRTVWFGMGAHAGWVLAMKTNGFLTDISDRVPWNPWLGSRGDCTDSLLTAIMLSTLMIGALVIPPTKQARAKPHKIGKLILTAILLVLAVGSFGMWDRFLKHRLIPRNWGVVEEGRIFRSGQLSKELVENMLQRNNIQVVVDMTREEPGNLDQRAEKEAIDRLAIQHIRLPLSGDGRGDIRNYALAIAVIVKARQQAKPVLVHCAAGAQRTGGVVAAYRLLVEKQQPSTVYKELMRYEGNPNKSKVLIAYLNENMETLASLLNDMGIIDSVPQPPPRLNP